MTHPSLRYPVDLTRNHKVAMLLEINRAIPWTEVSATVEVSDRSTVRLSPLGEPSRAAPRGRGEWATVFAELDRFFAELLAQEAGSDVTAEVHVFGCAPLPVMFYVGSRLGRRPLTVYQQDRDSGTWTAAFTTTDQGHASEFLAIEGVPQGRQPGQGYAVVSIGVTHSVHDTAEAQFLAATGLEPLAKVRAVPAGGVSPQAVRGGSDAASAARQLRDALDALHTRLPAADRVLLALSSSASFACALGTSINPNAQHALVLHNYRPDEGYVAVYEIKATDPGPARPPRTAEDTLSAVETIERIAEVYERLAKWIATKPDLSATVGGADFEAAAVQRAPVDGEPFAYLYMDGRWVFDTGFALALRELKESIPGDDWAECLRLFFVHEGFHTRQGLTTYRFQGIGRAGFVLEALDYDADVKSIEACLEWRRYNRRDDFEAAGELGSLAQILANILRMARTFNPSLASGSAHELLERHLRRFLIWAYQLGRARGFAAGKGLAEFRLTERVVVELPGLPARADFQNGYFRPHVGVTGDDVTEEAELVVYHDGRLFRRKDSAWISRLLGALRRGDLDELVATWAPFFDEHAALTGRGR